MTLTRADAQGWTMRQTVHYNGGKDWFGYGHQCVQQPRLYRLDRYTRKDRAVTSTWSVDGDDCADLGEAVERLNADPVVTADEIAALKLLTTEFQPLRDVRATDAYKALPQGTLSHWCSRKGLVWAENGQARLTELGARILRDSGSDPQGGDANAAPGEASQSGGSDSERIAHTPPGRPNMTGDVEKIAAKPVCKRCKGRRVVYGIIDDDLFITGSWPCERCQPRNHLRTHKGDPM